ncbi:putative bifunctional diguanylate cyclase/phosphodiesterase [Streptomyces sp. TR02-1]|uniref:putative bifunctional diguanylate cyclase/phosphodiesterase n=1 Tax=Streptomyces sp. TR02-1 TaxID=3385977 RepID=UPI0039A1B55A
MSAQGGGLWVGPGCSRSAPSAASRPRIGLRLLLAALCGGYAAGAALGWGSERLALVMGDFGLSAAALLAALSCAWHARTRSGSRFRPAWYLFALSSGMAALGNGVWGWYEVVLEVPVPNPSPADFCFLLFAPPAIVGLLVLAKRPVTRAGWTCLALDSWLIGGSLLTVSWSLALSHTASWQRGSVASAALELAYPLLDIVLISIALALQFRRPAADRAAISTAVGALALTVLCDALFTSPLLREHYSSGQFLDAGWFAGSLVLAYAPWAGLRRPRSQACSRAAGTDPVRSPEPPEQQARPIAGSLAALTPYLAAAVSILSIIHSAVDGSRVDRVVLLTGCTVVLVLVVRQGIMLLDNLHLTQELAEKENHFRSLVQGSSDVIMIVASTGVLRYVSPAAAGVYGREAGELVGSELASLIHPEDLARVLHEIRRFLAAPPEKERSTRIECRFRHGAGHWLNIESTVNRHQGGVVLNSRDVTERVRLQRQLQHSASHDPLTDLPNRALFTDRVRQALAGRRGGDRATAVLYIDLDGFKLVNDTVGHHAGDELLVHAARRLRDSVRAGDTAARLGGDEFAALVLGDAADTGPGGRERRVREIAERLRSTLSEPYVVHDGTEVRVAASIGIAFAEPGITPDVLLRRADQAMYRAKQAGKDRVELYTRQPPLRLPQQARPARAGQEPGELAVLHQPVVELRTGRVTAVWAQARWRSAQGMLLPPAGIMQVDGVQGTAAGQRAARLGRRFLDEAVAQAANRHRAGIATPLRVPCAARRLTGRQPPGSGIESLLARHGLPPACLVLELSVADPRISWGELEEQLTALRAVGVGIALDGLGCGHVGITALSRLPLDGICLDRGLVEGVVDSVRARKIVAGLLGMADDLGLTAVADGIDRPEQVVVLRGMGCAHGRGAAFSGALDEHRLRRALSSGGYPLPPGRSDGPEPAAASVSSALPLPVRRGGASGPDPLITHSPPSRPSAPPDDAYDASPSGSHSETPVPPT